MTLKAGEPKAPRKKGALWIGAVGGLLTLACLIFFAIEFNRLIGDGALDLQVGGARLALSLVAYLGSYSSFAIGWVILLGAMGIASQHPRHLGIHATTQFAKYLPGNVGHHLGRAGLTARAGVPLATVAATMTFEILLLLTVLGMCGLPLISRWTFLFIEQWSGSLPALGLLVSLGAAAVIAAFLFRRHRLFSVVSARIKHQISGIRVYHWTRVGGVIAVMFVGTLSAAFALAILDKSGVLLEPRHMFYVLSLFSVAFVLGFLTPGAPAGIGVREVILLEGLTPLIGREGALTAALLSRIVSTVGDFIVFLAGILLLRFAGAAPTASPDESADT